MTKRYWIGLLLIVLLVVGSILVRQPKPNDSDVLKIGVLAILSGDAAAWGQNAQKGFDLAIKETNSTVAWTINKFSYYMKIRLENRKKRFRDSKNSLRWTKLMQY